MLSKLKQTKSMAQKNQLTTSDHMEYSEYEKLLSGLHKDKNYFWELYARVAFCTACRAGDILNMRWIDILDKDVTTIVEQKTRKARKITFNKSVKAKIHRLWELMDYPNRAEYVFKNSRTGNKITIQYVNQKLKLFKYKYDIKIHNFSTHTFRKTFGRYVYDQSGHSAESLLLLNKILNHSSIQVTKTYIGITQDEIQSIFDSIKF